MSRQDPVRIGLVSTLDTNVGDDLIRAGVVKVLTRVFEGRELELRVVNKHIPFTAYVANLGPTGALLKRRVVRSAACRIGKLTRPSRFHDVDLIVQCGTPVYFPGCDSVEWSGPVWRDIIGELHYRIPVLNLAAGSCYPWERQPDRFDDPDEREFVRSITEWCRLTTTRDPLASALVAQVGERPPVLPCTALLSQDAAPPAGDDGYVLVNFMDGGGHFRWDQAIDPQAWRDTVRELVGRLKSRHRVAFFCHNDREYALARELWPSEPRFLTTDVRDFTMFASRAKAALCNRMHGAVVMGALGIPALAVCTDTRLLMVAETGLPTRYVTDALDVDDLESIVEGLVATRVAERDRLDSLARDSLDAYVGVVSEALHLG